MFGIANSRTTLKKRLKNHLKLGIQTSCGARIKPLDMKNDIQIVNKNISTTFQSEGTMLTIMKTSRKIKSLNTTKSSHEDRHRVPQNNPKSRKRYSGQGMKKTQH